MLEILKCRIASRSKGPGMRGVPVATDIATFKA